jgi:hypothetical protein
VALEVEGGPIAAPDPRCRTVELRNIDPVCHADAGKAAHGRSAEEVTRNPRQGSIVAVEPDGAAVVAITAELQSALTSADDALRTVAVSWARTDELEGSDPARQSAGWSDRP